MGDVAAGGGLGSSLSLLGNTFEGSAEFMVSQPEQTDFNAEESDYPIFIKKRQGPALLKFSVMDPDADVIARACGGVTALVTVAAWANATAYVFGDYVSSSGSYYRCKVAHTSATGSIVVTTTLYWDLLPAQPKTWSAPAIPPSILQSVTVLPQQGFSFSIIRGAVSAAINHKLSKTGLMLVDFEVRVLQPTLAGQAPIVYTGG
jgi:hypothetical protein